MKAPTTRSLRRARLGVVTLVSVVAFLSSIGLTGPAAATATTVWAGRNASGGADRTFDAAAITIGVGDTVRWEWFDGQHDVQGYNGTFSSGARGGLDTPGEVFARTFTAPGTYTYYCSNHAGNGDADPTRIDERIAAGKMVGKVVVVADTTAPITSSVTATPNPTSGATSFILAANVADQGAPVSPIAAAEYFLGSPGGDGTGIAMSAFDGSFDAPNEGVVAVVGTVGLAPGNHTLAVHGRDSAGNWGPPSTVVVSVTGAIAPVPTASITLTAGSLSNTARPVAFPSAALNGQDQVLEASPPAWEAQDATGSAAGWNVTVTATGFTSTAGAIAVSDFKIRLLNGAIVTLSGGPPPASQVPAFVPLDTQVPTRVLSALAGTGMGRFAYTPDFQLTVPASTRPGDYTASLVVSVNSGP